MTASRILVIYAHPAQRRSRANKPLAQALAGLPGVAMHDLYWRYPDFDIDVRAEQAALEAAEVVAFQFPVQWYATPSLLKEWLDVVLEMGWTRAGRHGAARQARAGAGDHRRPRPRLWPRWHPWPRLRHVPAAVATNRCAVWHALAAAARIARRRRRLGRGHRGPYRAGVRRTATLAGRPPTACRPDASSPP